MVTTGWNDRVARNHFFNPQAIHSVFRSPSYYSFFAFRRVSPIGRARFVVERNTRVRVDSYALSHPVANLAPRAWTSNFQHFEHSSDIIHECINIWSVSSVRSITYKKLSLLRCAKFVGRWNALSEHFRKMSRTVFPSSTRAFGHRSQLVQRAFLLCACVTHMYHRIDSILL